MTLKIWMAATGVFFLTAGSALAHHSIAAYDLSKRFSLTGTLTKIDWRNPHVELFVEVKNDRGQIESWVIETNAPSFFRNRILTKSDFEDAIGKTVTVEGIRAADGSLSGFLARVTMPTGKSLLLAPSSPGGTR